MIRMGTAVVDAIAISHAEAVILAAVRDLQTAGYGELRVSVKDGKLTIMATERILLSE